MVRVPGWSQVEPDPSTIATPVDPPPTTASESETLPPLVMLSVPLPSCPTKQNTSLVHVEPEPETVAVPVEPALCPSAKSELETVAPPVILRDPEPFSPIYIAPSSWRLPAPEIDRVPASPAPTDLDLACRCATRRDLCCAAVGYFRDSTRIRYACGPIRRREPVPASVSPNCLGKDRRATHQE